MSASLSTLQLMNPVASDEVGPQGSKVNLTQQPHEICSANDEPIFGKTGRRKERETANR